MQAVLYSPSLGTLDMTATADRSGRGFDMLVVDYDMGLFQPELSAIQGMFGDIQNQTGSSDRTPVFHVAVRAEAEVERAAGGEMIGKWINAGDCELRYIPTDGPTSCLLILSGYVAHVAAPSGGDDKFAAEWQGDNIRWYEVHLTTAPQVLAAEAVTASLTGNGIASGMVSIEGTFPAAATVVATASAGLGETIVYTGPDVYDPALRSRMTTYTDGAPIISQRVNLMPYPTPNYGMGGWSAGTGTSSVTAIPGAWNASAVATGLAGFRSYVDGPSFPVTAGRPYAIQATSGIPELMRAGIMYRWYNLSGAQIGIDATVPEQAAVAGVASKPSGVITAPDGAVSLRLYVYAKVPANQPPGSFQWWFSSVLVEQSTEVGSYFDGDTPDAGGSTYAWSGTPGASTSIAQTSVATVASRPSIPHFHKGSTDWVRLDGASFSIPAADLPAGDCAFVANVADPDGTTFGKTILPVLTIQTVIGGNVVDAYEAGGLGVSVSGQDSIVSLGGVTIDHAGIGPGAESSATIVVTVADPSGALYFDEVFAFRIDRLTSLTMVDAGAGPSSLGVAHSRVTVAASPRPDGVPTVTRGLSSDATRYIGPGITLTQMEPPMMQPGDNFVYVASAGIDDTVSVAVSYRSAHSTYVDAA